MAAPLTRRIAPGSLSAPRGLMLVLLIALSLLLSAAPAPSQAGEAPDTIDQTYQMPPQVIADMIDAPPTPFVTISPDNEWMLLFHRPGLPPIEEVAQPELRLAGLRINPRSNGPSRGRYYDGLSFRRLENGRERPVSGLPEGARLSYVRWSPDGKHISFVVTLDSEMTLWSAKLKDGKARRLSARRLNAAYGFPYSWLSDNKTLILRCIPAKRGAPPAEPLAPDGPVIQENLGRVTPARTLQDLLQNAHDEDIFDYYCSSQLVRVTLRGKAKELGAPGVIRGVASSPDGRFLRVEAVHRPYSYSLQQRSFPLRVEIWDTDGEFVYLAGDLPLQDSVPISFGSVAIGRRGFQWRDDMPAQLVWVEALDGGDGGVEAEERDRVFMLEAPFTGEPQTLITLGQRYGGVTWCDEDLAVVSSWWWATRNMKVWLVKPGDPDAEPELMQDRSWQDRYNDPGQPVMERNKWGRYVIMRSGDGKSVFMMGEGASPEGNRPFLDLLNLASGESERLFRSEAPYYENPVELLDAKKLLLLTRRESQTDPPNYFVRDLKKDKLEQKTFFPNPTPQLEGITKELIKYQREDGVDLTGTLYLPADYDAERDGPLPTLMWAYPREFKSADTAGQVTDSPYRFTRVGWWSPMLFLTMGYAVLDGPTMPIIGEGDEEPNDSYIEQQVMGARAAVEEVVSRGVADRERIAIGGHSYGAFMTANLLAHSDLFRLGLPRSGAYNRTLTPFGFQAEERTIWDAPEVYFAMSPFMHADKIDEPILMIHGEADNNAGTYPMQSERFYAALKALGGTARLVMLPHESHGYRARESIMHVLWETSTWLERYVKHAPPRDPWQEGSGD